jgi:hypothetical protein
MTGRFGVGIAIVLATGVARAQQPELVPPMQLDAEQPAYPDGAHGDAVVTLELEIAKDGSIAEVKVTSGEAPFAAAAREAAWRWWFAPATRGGIPIRARIVAKVRFVEPVKVVAPPSTSAAASTSAGLPPPLPPVGAVEIRVVGEEREEVGSTHIPRNETRLVPGAFADPFRVVEVMPGVAPVLSGLPYFFVRGSPPGDVGYFIDNIRVPILFHVGPGPSVIAPMLIDRVDLFPAAYPARYGRYVGGIMAGETSAPRDVARGEAQARVFDASGLVETPFANGRGSAAIGGRYSYMGAILAAVAPDYGLGYGDAQARIGYAVSDRDTVSLFAFSAFDKLTNEALKRTLFDISFHRIDLRWDRRTEGGRIRVAATLGADRALATDEGRDDRGTFATSKSARVRLELDQRIARGLRLRAGGDLGVERFENDRDPRFSSASRTDAIGGVFLEAIARASSRIELVPGVRVDVARSRGEDFIFVDPRFASRVRVAEGVAWISAFGVAHQLPTAVVRVPGIPPGALELSPQQAFQMSQGIEVALPEKMLAKVTAFRTRLLGRDVQGNNYGVEIFLRRDFTERLGGFLSYTFSRTERWANGDVFVSGFDRTHVLSLVLGYNLGRGFRVGGRLYYSSGRPYFVSCGGVTCEGRMPPFSRVDLRFEKRWTFTSGSWIAGTFEWFNALLSREAEYAEWNPQTGVTVFRRSPLTIPSVGVEAGF